MPLVTALLLVPLITYASIPFWGPIIPPSANNPLCAPGWGFVVEVINRIIQFSVTVAIAIVAPIMITWAGALLVTSGGNPGARTKAKSMLLSTVVGIAVALSAWLIVNALMAVLYKPDPRQGFPTNWYNLIVMTGAHDCIPLKASLDEADLNTGVTGFNVDGEPQVGGGTCTPPSSGPCSLVELENACFGSNANEAGQICAQESGGNPGTSSRTDILADGNPYSIGLFQINLTNSFSQKVNGRSCSSAFSAPCQGSAVQQTGSNIGHCSSTVVDQVLYAACVTAAKDAVTNIVQACKLSSNGTSWSRWRYSANKCNL